MVQFLLNDCVYTSTKCYKFYLTFLLDNIPFYTDVMYYFLPHF